MELLSILQNQEQQTRKSPGKFNSKLDEESNDKKRRRKTCI